MADAGLGLAVSKEFIKAMRGSIDVLSKDITLFKGCIFLSPKWTGKSNNVHIH